MEKRVKQLISFLLAFAMVIGLLPGLELSAFAADASDYTAGTYTATARVDESVGLRATVSITGNSTSNTAIGISPTDTGLARSNASAVITNDSSLTIAVTPFTNYTLTKVVVAAIATVTHADGSKDAIEDVQTFTTATTTYTVPDFSSYVTSTDSVDVEVVAYADFTYSTPSADYTIDVSTGTVRDSSGATLTLPSNGFTLSGKTFILDTATLHDKTVEITGSTYNTVSGSNVGAYQVYVWNSNYSTTTGTDRRINLVLNDAKFFAAVSMTESNYDSSTAGRGATFYSARATTAGQTTATRKSTGTKSTYSSLILSDVDAYVTLKGSNIMAQGVGSHDSGGTNQAGLAVDASASLIITNDSTGTLYVRGGGCSAAIGTSANQPCGYVEIDGGAVTAESAHSAHKYAGIGNGGHYTAADPGIRGIVVNGGTVNALGFHYGIGGNGGTSSAYNFSTYIVITGGNVTAEGSAGSGGAAIGFAYNNSEHQVRIGRPDKGDNDSSVTAINWGYGAAISGEITFYSGTTEAYSGEYAAAIGGNAVSNATISSATAAQAQAASSAITGTPLTVYGGKVTAEAGAFSQVTWTAAAVRGGSTRTSSASVANETRATASYGAAIGGAVSKTGGTENYIFGGTFDVTSSVYGAGIGGGGAYSTSQSGGGGGSTWIGTLTDISTGTATVAPMSFNVTADTYGAAIGGGGALNSAAGSGGDLYIAGGEFNIESGTYGAGIGGGGSYGGAGGNGGNIVAIRGGEFTITSGTYGAGIGGGGSESGAGGSGGNKVTLDVETDTTKIATSTQASEYLFEIKSGQFGAGIGGGGSISGVGGAGPAELTITGGNFGITAGANIAGINGSSYSYGAGIGGGGSYSNTAGNGPSVADISGGYFDVYTMGYGSAIGGGGSNDGYGGSCGTIYVTGGTIRAENLSNLSDDTTKGLGGGASADSDKSMVADGTVIIIGGNVYTSAGTNITGAYAGQHVWTRPNMGDKPNSAYPYTEPTLWTQGATAYTLPVIDIPGLQDMYNENTTQQGQEVGGILASRIGEQVFAVQYSFPARDSSGAITSTTTYGDYGINDMFITPVDDLMSSGAVSVWVPSAYILNYDVVTTGGSINPVSTYDVLDSLEYAYGTITILTNSTASYIGDGQTKALIEQGVAIDDAIFDGLYEGRSYIGEVYRDLLYHADATSTVDNNSYPVVFAGWSITPDSTIYELNVGSSPTLLKEVTFQTDDITVYAVWGFDKNNNGIADIMEADLELSYNNNPIGSGSASAVPTSSYGNWGITLPISSSSMTHDAIAGKDVVFVGWSTEQLTDVVTVANHTLTAQATALSNLYNNGGNRTFTLNGSPITLTSSGGFTILEDTTLYAVWALDANQNGIPDYLEPTYVVSYQNNATTSTVSMPTGGNYVEGDIVDLDNGSTLTGVTDTLGTDLKFLYWTTDATMSSTIYTVGAATSNLLPTEAVSPITITIPGSDVTLYAVWSTNAIYPGGIADAYLDEYHLIYDDIANAITNATTIDDGTGVQHSYPTYTDATPYYEGYLVTTLAIPVDPTGWHFEGWTDALSLAGTYTNEAAWNTKFGGYPATGVFKDTTTNTVDFGNSDITLYAVWSKDDNGNGIADWTETTPTPQTGTNYVRYIAGDTVLSAAGYALDSATVPFASNVDTSSAELVTIDDNGLNLGGSTITSGAYADGASVSLDLASVPQETNGDLVFLGWSPINSLPLIYGGSSSDLQNYIKHIQLIYDIQEGTNYSNSNSTTNTHGYDPISQINTGTGTGYTPESVAGRAYYTRLGASSSFDSGYASGFSGYDWNLYTVSYGLLNNVVESPYFVQYDSYDATSATAVGEDYSLLCQKGWSVYGVWAVDANHNGIADMFENKFTLYYDGNDNNTNTVSNIPSAQSNILPDETVALATGKFVSTTAGTYFQDITRYDSINNNSYIFLGWTADQVYNRGTAVSGDGSVYGVGDYANLPLIVSAVTFGSMDITVHALWGEDANNNGIPDVYEGSYSLIYDANGGTNAPVDTNSYLYSDVATLDSGASMTHASNYIFLYWTDDASVASVYRQGDLAILPNQITQVSFIGSNITVYAAWGEDANGNNIPDVFENPYSLTYDANGGSNAPTDTTNYNYNDTVTLSSGAGMSNASYVFVGWTLDDTTTYSSVYTVGQQSLLPTLETSVTFTSTNITVNAVWSTDLNNNGTPDVYETGYLLSYDLNGGTASSNIYDAQLLLAGQTITIPTTVPTAQTGDSFVDWSDGTSTYSAGGSFTMPANNVTLTAQYQSGTATTYTVTYDANGGTGTYADTGLLAGVSYTVKTAAATGITRSGYTLSGWNTAANAGGSNHTIGSTITISGNVTLYAQWTSNGSSGGGTGGGTSGGGTSSGGDTSGGTTASSYTLSYETNGGSTIAAETYAANTSVTLSKTSIREGYTFSGWYADATLTEAITSITMTSNKTVYASWSLNTSSPSILTDEHVAYIIGRDDNLVSPNANITRAEVVMIFYRLLTDEARATYASTSCPFTDLDENAWYYEAFCTIYNAGIIKGRTDTLAAPDAVITRAEFATIAARFESETYTGDNIFNDITGHWAAEYINRAATRGWITGGDNGSFRPDDLITRAEAITLINRVLCRIPESVDDLLDGMITWEDNADTSAWYYLPIQEATNGHTYERKTDSIYETWIELR